MKINNKSLLYGTLILTIANFIVRILGFIYRVIMSRLVGPQGMGLVQLVFPIFMIAITLSTSGLPIAVSRLVSEKKARGDLAGIRRTVFTALLLVTAVSLVLSLLTLTNLDFIVNSIIKDQRTKGALFILFPSIAIIGLGSVLKGFFYGIKDIHPPALAEITEQLVRMGVSFSLVWWLAPADNYAVVAGLVMAGTVFGEMASLLFLHYRYYKTTRVMYAGTAMSSSNGILQGILSIAIPITITRLVSTLMNAANAILIPQRLIASGILRDEALGLFGIMSGMVMPLLFMPFAITNALSVIIIPNLSENMAMKNWTDIREKVSKTFFITCMTAFPSIAFLVSLGKPLGDALYKQPMAGTLLVPMAYSLVFHALQHTTYGMLNGLGKQNRAAVHFIIGSCIQIACTYFLIPNPSVRIYGMIIGFTASSAVVCIMNVTTLLSYVKVPFMWVKWMVKPGFSSLVMASVLGASFKYCSRLGIPFGMSLTISLVIGLLVFSAALWSLGIVPDSFFNKLTVRRRIRKAA